MILILIMLYTEVIFMSMAMFVQCPVCKNKEIIHNENSLRNGIRIMEEKGPEGVAFNCDNCHARNRLSECRWEFAEYTTSTKRLYKVEW